MTIDSEDKFYGQLDNIIMWCFECCKAWSDHIIYGKPLPKFAQPIQNKTNDGGRNA